LATPASEGMTTATLPPRLPGADLVAAGIHDLQHGEFTIEALLVAIGATRLRGCGLRIPDAAGCVKRPELALYDAICANEPANAHSRYNALVRRLVSFEQAMDNFNHRAKRGDIDRAGQAEG